MTSRLFLFGAFMAVSTVADAGGKGAEVEASFVRIDTRKEVLVYNVKINDKKPIKQVDFRFRYLDAAGKEQKSEEFIWQNNKKGALQPIEAGKTYEHEDSGQPEGCAKAEITVLRIHYKDGTVVKK